MRRHFTRALGGFAAIAVVAGSPLRAATPPTPGAVDSVEQQALAIRDRFIGALRSCGVRPSFIPSVAVHYNPGIVSYTFADRTVHLTPWSELPAPLKGMMAGWAKAGTLGLDPENQFREIFDTFLVAHELGHYLQMMSGRKAQLDRWESEVEANRIAIAFWSRETGGGRSVATRVENITRFLGTFPNPVPEGTTPKDFFNTRYMQISSQPQVYGWFQGAFMRTAWAEHRNNDFCHFARLKPTRPAR